MNNLIKFKIALERLGTNKQEFAKIGKLIRRSNETIYHYLTKALAVYHAETIGQKLTATEININGYVYDLVIFDPKTGELTAIEIYDTHRSDQTKIENSNIPILEFEAIRDLSCIFDDKRFQDIYFMVGGGMR